MENLGKKARLPSLLTHMSFESRVLAGGIVLAFGTCVGTIIALICAITGFSNQAGWLAAPFVRLPFEWMLGTRFRIISGSEHLRQTRPAVLISNHQTDLDIVMLSAIWPRYCSVVAKTQTRNRPFIGLFVKLCGAIFVDRNNTQKDISTLDQAAARIRDKDQNVFLFAEGTRGRQTTPALLPFKKGAFHLAIKAGVPILPVVTEIYDHIYNRQNKCYNRGTVRIKGTEHVTIGCMLSDTLIVLRPVSTSMMSASDVDHLIENVRSLMLDELEAMARSTHSSKQ